MNFRDLINKAKPTEETQILKSAFVELSKQEIEILLNGLADASFTGRQLELVYRLALKLQTEHKKL